MLRWFCVCTFLTSPAVADAWSGQGFDDGVWFIGTAVSERSELMLDCGGRSARALAYEQSDVSEPSLTDPGTILLRIDPSLFGSPNVDALHGIAVNIDGTRHPLPPLNFSAFHGSYAAALDANHPVFADLGTGISARITQGGEPVAQIGLAGSFDAIQDMTQACAAGWASNAPVSPEAQFSLVSAQTQPQTHNPWTADAVNQLAADFCQGPAVADMEFVVIEDLDADGITDLLLNMGDVSCTDTHDRLGWGAGYCGASQCSTFVYLSRAIAPEPEEIFSLGIGTHTTDDGRRLITGGASLTTCAREGYEACEYRFDPANGTLEFLGVFPYSGP